MRILIITNYLDEKSGWGRYSLDLINQLFKNKIEIVVICYKKNNKYQNIKQIEILPSPLSFKKNYILTPFHILRGIKQLKKMNGFDFIHCLVEPYAFFTFLLSKILKTKYFLTIHGSYGIKMFYNKFYKFLQILSYKNAEKIICVSNYTKNRILKYKKIENIIVISNGVNLENFLLVKNSIRKENSIVGVGALKKRKGFDISVRILDLVKKQIPDIKYYIIGNQNDKNYFDYLNNLIEELDLKDNIIFLKNISDNELKKIYQKSKVFLLTPVSDKYNFEGFGLVYLEANALGLPVIGSYDNGGEDAIKNGYNGFLTDPLNINNTAKKIIKILNNDNIYDRISKDAIKWARKLSWEHIIKKYLKAYRI